MPSFRGQRATLASLAFLSAASAAWASGPGELLQVVLPDKAGGAVESSWVGLSCAATCSAVVPAGDTIVLAAKAAPGRQFDGWSGDCAGWDPTCELRMDGTKVVVASFKPAGSRLAVVRRFLPGTPSSGSLGRGGLLADAGYVFGFTAMSGRADRGTVFRIEPDGTGFALLHSFSGGAGDGASPDGALVESGGYLWGVTVGGGPDDHGAVFRIRPDGSDLALVHVFAAERSEGAHPVGPLVATGGALGGTTLDGGPHGGATAFKVDESGTGFTVLHALSGPDGSAPQALTAVGRSLVGMAASGGLADGGVLFRLDVLPAPIRRHLAPTPRPPGAIDPPR